MNTQISRRACLGILGSVTASALTGSALAQSSSPPLRYGLQRGALANLRLALTEGQGKFGIAYDQKVFNDATAVLLALEQRELDIGNVTAQHVVRGIERGMNMVVICGYGGGSNVLAVNPDVKLEPNDIEGFKSLVAARRSGNKFKIGTPTGSMQHLKLITFLKSISIDPDKDVDIVNVAFQDHVRALDGRQIDMAMALAGFASMAAVNGAGKIFYHVYGNQFGKWELGVAARKDIVAEKPELIQKVVDSHVAALTRLMADDKAKIELEMKDSSFPPKVIEMEQGKFRNYSYKIGLDDIKRTAVEMYQMGWTPKDLSSQVDQFVDFRFLEKSTGQTKGALATL